jgi:hypothetical protein
MGCKTTVILVADFCIVIFLLGAACFAQFGCQMYLYNSIMNHGIFFWSDDFIKDMCSISKTRLE